MTANTARNEDPEFFTDMSVGEILRRTRLHYGQSLEDVERVLRIRASQLEALETGDVEKLPGRVYAIGFVRSYSEYLGLDGNKMVHLFKTQSGGGPQPRAEISFPASASESKTPGWFAVIGSVIAAIVVFGAWVLIQQPFSGNNDAIPPVPTELAERIEHTESMTQALIAEPQPDGSLLAPAPAAAPEGEPAAAAAPAEGQAVAPENAAVADITATPEGAPATAAQAPVAADIMTRPVTGDVDPLAVAPAAQVPLAAPVAAQPAVPSDRVSIVARENTWIEIRDIDGMVVFSRVLRQGDQYTVPEGIGYVMSTGNAGGIEIQVGGQPVPALGGRGEVKRYVSLSPASLRNPPKSQQVR